MLTILRHPVARCISFYYYARNIVPSSPDLPPDIRAAKEYGINDFFNQDVSILYRGIFNRQVRQLGDHVLNLNADIEKSFVRAKQTLKSAMWVGRQETLAEDIVRLEQLSPDFVGLSLPRLNTTEGEKTDQLSDESIYNIISMNKYDMKLYGDLEAGR